MEVKLFSVKVGDQIYYVPAIDYAQAEKKFFEQVPTNPHTTPDKITLVCGAQHLLIRHLQGPMHD